VLIDLSLTLDDSDIEGMPAWRTQDAPCRAFTQMLKLGDGFPNWSQQDIDGRAHDILIRLSKEPNPERHGSERRFEPNGE
jgi:hypothetical protein